MVFSKEVKDIFLPAKKKVQEFVVSNLENILFINPIPSTMRDYSRLSENLESDGSNIADETSPWTAFREQIVLWEAEGLKNLAATFPNQAVNKTSMGDASIVILGLYYHQKGFHVEFLTDDSGLKSQEPPPPTTPTRRSSRGK